MISLKRLTPLAAVAALVASSAHAQGEGQGPDLTRLHAALRLTPAQEGAWRAFAAASQPDPEQEARERAAEAMLPSLHAPQRVDLGIAAMEADLDTLRRRGQALKSFYATLSPGQQAVFDRQTAPQSDADD